MDELFAAFAVVDLPRRAGSSDGRQCGHVERSAHRWLWPTPNSGLQATDGQPTDCRDAEHARTDHHQQDYEDDPPWRGDG